MDSELLFEIVSADMEEVLGENIQIIMPVKMTIEKVREIRRALLVQEHNYIVNERVAAGEEPGPGYVNQGREDPGPGYMKKD